MNKKDQISALEALNRGLRTKVKDGEVTINNLTKNLKEALDKVAEPKEVTEDGLDDKIVALKSELSFLEGISSDVEYGIYNPDLDFVHTDYITTWKNHQKDIRDISKSVDTINIIKPMKLAGNQVRGIKLQKDVAKLGLIHLNNFAKIQYKTITQLNVVKNQEKFEKEFNKTNKILSNLNVSISNSFYNIILEGFEIAMDMKLQKEEDRENAKIERQRIREEEKLKAEVEAKMVKIDKEVEQYKLRISEINRENIKGNKEMLDEISKLKAKIAKLDDDSSELETRLSATGAGYVYIISNIGSLGEGIFKIGVTRRIDPMVRIKELSSASVPFIYDKHALIWSEQAFQLEKALHDAFDNQRVNKINKRKEFFHTNIEEIKTKVAAITDTSVKWITEPEAIQYRLTLEEEAS